MRRGPDRLLLEIPLTVVEKGDDGFMLLADEGDEVLAAVAVKIANGDVNGPVAIVENARLEPGMVAVERVIFQVKDLAALLPAEHADHEVHFTDAAKVGGLHVGHAAYILEQR